MAGPEATVERRACELALRDWGVSNEKLNIGGGWPDRMFLIPGGRPFFIEFKRLDGQAKKRQLYVHKKLKKLGYDVEIHDTVDGAINAVQKRVEEWAGISKSGKIKRIVRVPK